MASLSLSLSPYHFISLSLTLPLLCGASLLAPAPDMTSLAAEPAHGVSELLGPQVCMLFWFP